MPISIECPQCHGKFAGKESLVGRRIRCPSCQEVFRVPADGAASSPATPATNEQTHQAGRTAPAAQQPEEFDEWNVPADFEYKVKEPEVGKGSDDTYCPFCRAEMNPGDVLCMSCGFNRKLGEKIVTKTGDEAFEEPKAEKPGSISLGGIEIPIPVLLAVGGVLALFGIVMLIVAPALLALMLLAGGLLLSAVGGFWVILIAFQEDPFQGLLAWFVPIYWWVYALSRLDAVLLPFCITMAGLLMIFFGGGILCSGGGGEDTDAADQVSRVLFLMHANPTGNPPASRRWV